MRRPPRTKRTDTLFPYTTPFRSVLKWLIWQVAGHGPMNGQAHHFLRYAPEGQDYGVTRYVREVVRLLNVLEYRLAEADYLGGSDYSIADMAAWPRSEEHTSELQSLMRISYAVFCLKKKKNNTQKRQQ